MKIRLAVIVAAFFVSCLAAALPAYAQTLPRCVGGCDAEYGSLLGYDPYYMWAAYGYPTYGGGCWWYDVEGQWWYMCPPDGNLYPYGS